MVAKRLFARWVPVSYFVLETTMGGTHITNHDSCDDVASAGFNARLGEYDNCNAKGARWLDTLLMDRSPMRQQRGRPRPSTNP